jgi:hypothetical protein
MTSGMTSVLGMIGGADGTGAPGGIGEVNGTVAAEGKMGGTMGGAAGANGEVLPLFRSDDRVK